MMTIIQRFSRFLRICILKTWHMFAHKLSGNKSETDPDPLTLIQVREHREQATATTWLRHAEILEEGKGRQDEYISHERDWMQEATSWNPKDIDQFAEGRHVSKETLESWISAGLLHPDEITAAEKVIRAIRRQDSGNV